MHAGHYDDEEEKSNYHYTKEKYHRTCTTFGHCEAQGEGRAKGRLRKSIVDYRYRLSIIDIDFPEALH